MDSESVFKYMKYRLKTAGARYNLFDSEAMTQIFLISRGVPRQINKVCDMCLLKAFLANKKKVDREMVLKSAAELGLEIPLIIKSSNTSSQQLPVTASTVPSDRSAESEEQAFDGLPRVESDLSENTKVPADPSGGKNKKKAFKPKALMPKTRSQKRRNRGNWLRTATYTAMNPDGGRAVYKPHITGLQDFCLVNSREKVLKPRPPPVIPRSDQPDTRN